MRVIVPAQVEAAKERLADIEQARRTTGWERAAIVWAHTREAGRGRNTPDGAFGLPEMAEALGISVRTINRAREAWKTAMEKHGASDVKPGEDVELPSIEYPPSEVIDGNEPTGRDQRGFDAMTADPTKLADAIKANPEGAKAVAKAILASPAELEDVLMDAPADLTSAVANKALSVLHGTTQQQPARPSTPSAPDFNAQVRRACSDLFGALAAERNGEWTPDGVAAAGLTFLTSALNSREANAVAPLSGDLLQGIEDFLAGKVAP